MEALSLQAWATLAVVGAMLAALVRDVARPDLILVGAVGALVAMGILTPQEAFAGFSNGAVIAVASLFVLAAGVQNTGALNFADRFLFPKQGRPGAVALRMGPVLAVLSAFLNNTPLVAMMMPRVRAWGERAGVPPSKLMIPLSYATIVGGVTTLVGTSTNLVVAGLMQGAGAGTLGMFTQTTVAVPAALAALLVIAFVSVRLLPGGGGRSVTAAEGLRRALFEVRVPEGSPLVGRTIEEAKLRALETAFLVHVRRGDEILEATPETTLRARDVLTFQGSARALDALLARPDLVPAVEPVAEPALDTLPLYEAVVADSSSLVGRTLREAEFREHYGGVVLAIQRADDTLQGPLGRTPLRPGDLLLVEARNGFDRTWNARRDEFYLVAARREEQPKAQPGKAPLALGILLGAVALAAVGVAPIETTAFVGAVAMIAFRVLRARHARRALDIPTLVVIAMALGIGRAIETTGLAAALAHVVVDGLGAFGPFGIVVAVYLATMVLTELITNNAAAALMIAIGIEAAAQVGVEPVVFGVTVAVAASASFLTPIGYQTNLMVMSAGGYKFSDYLRAGLPVSLTYGSVALGMIYFLWF
ncbi:MAG TPA: SLC13 family permease [Rubricoccaceae bacterium]|nr:SLC13 family permease [Rubricoccaceae bacterium]